MRERALIAFIEKNGPIECLDGRKLTVAINLIEILTNKSSCRGCVFEADDYHDCFEEVMKIVVDDILEKLEEDPFIGCTQRPPKILVYEE